MMVTMETTIGESPRSAAVSLSDGNNDHPLDPKESVLAANANGKQSGNDKMPTNENNSDDGFQLLPLVSWKPGLQQKSSPLALNSWTTLALTLDGTNKNSLFLFIQIKICCRLCLVLAVLCL
jgi:hypothetical protein